MRKFAPDGRHFVAFSRDQSSLEIYEFLGPDAAEDLLRSRRRGNKEREDIIRDTLFDRFFRKKATVTVTSNGEHLNRECSLFTDNGRHVIVGSANTVPDEPPPHFYDKYKNNESVSPNQRSPLEDYTIHIVDFVQNANKLIPGLSNVTRYFYLTIKGFTCIEIFWQYYQFSIRQFIYFR